MGLAELAVVLEVDLEAFLEAFLEVAYPLVDLVVAFPVGAYFVGASFYISPLLIICIIWPIVCELEPTGSKGAGFVGYIGRFPPPVYSGKGPPVSGVFGKISGPSQLGPDIVGLFLNVSNQLGPLSSRKKPLSSGMVAIGGDQLGVDVQGLLGFIGRGGNSPGSIASFGSNGPCGIIKGPPVCGLKGAGLLTCGFVGQPPLGIPELSGVPIDSFGLRGV